MIKKLVFTALFSSTILIAGAFIMKDGEQLKKVGGQTIKWNENITSLVHPGIYHTAQELDSLRGHVNSSSYLRVKNSSLQYSTPTGYANMDCGSYNSGDEKICNDWYRDGRSAEYWALRAYVEKNVSYAATAVLHIDRWASIFQNVTGSNAPLISAWQLEKTTKAAELLLHNDYGYVYPAAEKARMESYADLLYGETQSGGNDYLANAQVGANWVAAALASKQAYWVLKHGLTTVQSEKDYAVERFKYWSSFNDSMVKSYIYLNSDAPLPIIFDSQGLSTPYSNDHLYGAELWRLSNNPDCFKKDGLVGEYWRDMWHTTMGIDFIGNMFEMSYIQGYKDFYSQHEARLIAGLEVIYAALLKKHMGGSNGYYLERSCSNTATTLSEPKISSSDDRFESAHAATLYKRAKEKGWDIPFMEEYNNNFMSTAEPYHPSYVYDYIFKGLD